VVLAGPLLMQPAPTHRSSSALLHVEIQSPAVLHDLGTAWHDLVARALEPNVFLSPAFALPAFAHLYPRTCRVLTVREAGFDGRLLALMPLVLPPPGRSGLARVPLHVQAALGTPLLDAAAGSDVLAAILGFLRESRPELVGLAFSRLPQDGGVFALAEHAAAQDGAALTIIEPYRRAVLPRGTAFDLHLRAAVTVRRQKELRRQERRLADTGALAFDSVEEPGAVAIATEAFLALEARGWKGARRTALVSQPPLATFVRAMTRGLAQKGQCRIDTLSSGGLPVAMGIVLTSGDTAAFWKTAYDERFASFSPGVHLVLRLTERQLALPAIAMTDSCAIADHPMIDRLWPARMGVADVVLPLRPADDPALVRTLRRDAARRQLRQVLKGAAHRLRGRAPS
jgi:CelD/BcsL family acetyltransferase involved in cellulose biosynthesis